MGALLLSGQWQAEAWVEPGHAEAWVEPGHAEAWVEPGQVEGQS